MKNNRNINTEHKRLPVLLHITGWIILFVLPQFLIIGDARWDTRTTLIIFFNTLIYGIIFYVNYLWLIPRLLHLRRGLWYFPAALVFMIGMQFASNQAFRVLFPPSENDKKEYNEVVKEEQHHGKFPGPRRMIAYNFYITSVLVTGFALGLRYGEKARSREREMKELEKEKLNSELAMLKNQISPHFFFNTLNNIYSLIEINTTDAQTSVLNLSKMMRYMLYESEHGNTKLSRELEFMKNYIDLMKLRLSSRVTLNVDFPSQYEDVDVPPLLFITFIENAFKHGVSYQGNPFIEISLHTHGSIITFIARNSINRQVQGTTPQVESGIGLENVRKRLNLLFRNNYDLNIEEKDSIYSVTLEFDATNVSLT
jgi:two-component system, LytTR family, sensor kinase